jgi:ATP-binding cassette subfamily B protein
VPQTISLLNRTVLENVAFGFSQDEADQDRVWEALEAAQLQDFVAELPYGLYTQVGENGLRLSGGQRQRLALARAFYRKASFLVLDEATSALDNRTESEVIEALEVIGRRCTTVVIAHRLSTVQRCDRIYEFADGRVKAYGSYGELQQRSDSFRELTRLEDRSASA